MSLKGSNDDDARLSTTVTDPANSIETHLPRIPSNPSLEEEIVCDESSIKNHGSDDIYPPLPKSLEAALPTPAAAPEHPVPDPYLVTWDGQNDPENPQAWSVRRKWTITVANTLMTLCVYVAVTSFVARLLTFSG
jgi:hypothetical protein